MSKVELYTKGHCPYCHRAKALLTQLGHEYTEKVVTKDISLEDFFKSSTLISFKDTN